MEFVKLLVETVANKFKKPDVIDKRRKEHFIDNVVQNAPVLKKGELRVLEAVSGLETALASRGKRLKKSLKEDIDKFLWREDDKVWAAYRSVIDESKKGILAELFDFDTYRKSRLHMIVHGNLPRKITRNVNGTRSLHYQAVRRLTGETKQCLCM